jgi:hypothetical protein
MEKLKDEVTPDVWIIMNIKHTGFYRVNYDLDNWKLLIKQLNEDHLKIDNINRAQLLDDSFNLGRAEEIDQTIFLNISKYLPKENDPVPFVAVFTGLNYIDDMLSINYELSSLFRVRAEQANYSN